MSSPPITFGVLSHTSFEQMINNIFPSPPDRLVPPVPISPFVAPLNFVSPSSAAPSSPETKKEENLIRERCRATTLESSPCKNWAKPTLPYCYAHRGLSSTKNADCPICLEKFTDPNEIFLLACAHQLHKDCMSHLRTDTCPVCRSCLTNLPKDLNVHIRARKNQDMTERNEEELQDALNRLGQGMNVVFSPFLMSSRGERTGRGAPQIVWPAIFSYPSSISMTDIFEDFIVRQNAERSSRSE